MQNGFIEYVLYCTIFVSILDFRRVFARTLPNDYYAKGLTTRDTVLRHFKNTVKCTTNTNTNTRRVLERNSRSSHKCRVKRMIDCRQIITIC